MEEQESSQGESVEGYDAALYGLLLAVERGELSAEEGAREIDRLEQERAVTQIPGERAGDNTSQDL